MPVYNFTIDDSSPFITYEGIWSDSTQDDTNNLDYRNQTFHTTQSSGASATFSFNGTGVYLYGAKRSNHGSYSVNLDGVVVLPSGGGGAGDEEYNATLYGVSDLTYGLHHVILTNTGAPSYLDLDFVSVTTGDGNPDTTAHDVVYDDTTSAFNYDLNWNNGAGDRFTKQFAGGTEHVTGIAHAIANVSFTGNAIKLYSATGKNHGQFSVSLDGAPPSTLNGTAPKFRPQNLLYYFDGLPDGDHVLTVEKLTGDYLDLDQAIVSSYIRSDTNAGSSPGPTDVPVNSSVERQVPVSVIVGSSVGALGLLALMMAGWLLLIRSRKSRAKYHVFDKEKQSKGALAAPSAKDHIPDGSSQSEASSVVPPRQAEPPLSPNDSPPSYVGPSQSKSMTSPQTTVFAKEKTTKAYVTNET